MQATILPQTEPPFQIEDLLEYEQELKQKGLDPATIFVKGAQYAAVMLLPDLSELKPEDLDGADEKLKDEDGMMFPVPKSDEELFDLQIRNLNFNLGDDDGHPSYGVTDHIRQLYNKRTKSDYLKFGDPKYGKPWNDPVKGRGHPERLNRGKLTPKEQKLLVDNFPFTPIYPGPELHKLVGDPRKKYYKPDIFLNFQDRHGNYAHLPPANHQLMKETQYYNRDYYGNYAHDPQNPNRQKTKYANLLKKKPLIKQAQTHVANMDAKRFDKINKLQKATNSYVEFMENRTKEASIKLNEKLADEEITQKQYEVQKSILEKQLQRAKEEAEKKFYDKRSQLITPWWQKIREKKEKQRMISQGIYDPNTDPETAARKKKAIRPKKN